MGTAYSNCDNFPTTYCPSVAKQMRYSGKNFPVIYLDYRVKGSLLERKAVLGDMACFGPIPTH
jgi:hypothetical protein